MSVIKCFSWMLHVCWQVSFKQAFNVGKISEYPPGYRGLGFVDVQCFPLYSYLLALNRTKIDYFSLDVEGSELDVLRTIPFEKLDIRVSICFFFHFLFLSLSLFFPLCFNTSTPCNHKNLLQSEPCTCAFSCRAILVFLSVLHKHSFSFC
jgi:hypothetical protein